LDWTKPLDALDPLGSQKLCVDRTTEKGARVVVQLDAMNIDGFIKFALSRLDRPVIDKTGLTGLFDFHLEYVPDTFGPSIFAALKQQLGLELTPAKGSGELLVIDRIEQLAGN